MKVFITGTDTDVGKTLISSWLCLHTGYDYFKPIQTGSRLGTDSKQVKNLTTDADGIIMRSNPLSRLRERVRERVSFTIYPEAYCFKEPLSPHAAASIEHTAIDSETILLPNSNNLIVEGAGGVLVPINQKQLMIDLIIQWQLPVIVIARSSLGTINHTLLTLEALRKRNIKVLGVIVNGQTNDRNMQAIENYGQINILAAMPQIATINKTVLLEIPLTPALQKLLQE